MYGLGWFGDHLDGDNYLSPFLFSGGFMQNGYEDATVSRLLEREFASTKRTDRAAIFGRLQDILARDVPLLPLWERKRIAVVRAGVEGVQATLDPSLLMRFSLLSKR